MNGLLIALTALSSVGNAEVDPVLARMDGGPLVIVQEDHRQPLVYMELRFPLDQLRRWDLRAGRHPPGMAHIVEHLAFRSGGDLDDGEFDRLLESAGGESNGWTSHDWMVLSMQFPPEAIGLALELEMGRMGRLTEGLSPDILKTELQVISQEWEMRRRDSSFADSQAIREQLYTADHAYGLPLIEPFLFVPPPPQEAIQEFEASSLDPENAVLVLVGDVDTAEVLALLGAGLWSPPETEGSFNEEGLPTLSEEMRRLWPEARYESVLYLAWFAPPAGHPDQAALEVLAAALALGQGSVLERALWRRRGAPREVSYRLDMKERGGELRLGVFDPKGSLGRNLRRMDRELSRIRNHGLRDAEIERARTWLIQQIQYEKTDPASVADAVLQQALGRESAGLDERIQAIQQISNADIQRVSHRWLVPERLILSVLPEEEQGRAPRGSHWIMSL